MVSRKRILYVEGNVDGTIGGSYFSLLFLVQALDRERYEPVVVFARGNELIPRFRANDVHVSIHCPPSPIRWRSGVGKILAKGLNFVQGFVLEPLRLARILRRERIQLLHLNNSITRNHPWIVGAKIARIPCITHERGINEHFKRRDRRLARSLDAIICISKAVENNFAQRGLEQLPTVTIHNGLDPADMPVTRDVEDIRKEFGIAADSRLIGIVGNVKPWKGQEVTIRAMGILRDEFPEVVCLLIGDTSAGDAHYRIELSELVERLRLKGRVIVTGYRADVANYVNALEIQIHASVAPEPFGRVLLEGMALRKPLVASYAGAIPEIIVPGQTGLMFTPGNAEELAECLRELLRDPDKARRFGEAGRKRLDEVFSITQNVSRTQELYDRLLD